MPPQALKNMVPNPESNNASKSPEKTRGSQWNLEGVPLNVPLKPKVPQGSGPNHTLAGLWLAMLALVVIGQGG